MLVHTLPAYEKIQLQAEDDQPFDDCIRVIILCDKQCNGAPAIFNEVFQSSPNTMAVRWRNIKHTGRFTMLSDTVYIVRPATVQVGASTGGGTPTHSTPKRLTHKISKTVKFKGRGLLMEYKNEADPVPIIDDVCCNNIIVWVVSDNGLTQCEATTRLRYIG